MPCKTPRRVRISAPWEKYLTDDSRFIFRSVRKKSNSLAITLDVKLISAINLAPFRDRYVRIDKESRRIESDTLAKSVIQAVCIRFRMHGRNLWKRQSVKSSNSSDVSMNTVVFIFFNSCSVETKSRTGVFIVRETLKGFEDAHTIGSTVDNQRLKFLRYEVLTRKT